MVLLTACAQCKASQASLDPDEELSRCSGCKSVSYCSAEHQKADWQWHKAACRAKQTGKPYIVHFDVQPGFSDPSPWCQPLYNAISIPHKRTFSLVTCGPDIRTVLNHPIPPDAILCTNPAIVAIPEDYTDDLANAETPEEVADIKQLQREDTQMYKEIAASLRADLRKYVDRGGRLILGGPIANDLPSNMLRQMFADFGVSWQFAGFGRSTHHLNPHHSLHASLPQDARIRADLPESYSVKSVHLKDVPSADALYRSTSTTGPQGASVTSSGVSVAMGKVGEGWLGWCGDVNQEAGSTQATLWMLGLKK